MMLPYVVVPKTWSVVVDGFMLVRFLSKQVPDTLNPPGDALSICSRKLNRKQEDQGGGICKSPLTINWAIQILLIFASLFRVLVELVGHLQYSWRRRSYELPAGSRIKWRSIQHGLSLWRPLLL